MDIDWPYFILGLIFCILAPISIRYAIKNKNSYKKYIFILLAIVFYASLIFIYYILLQKYQMKKILTIFKITAIISFGMGWYIIFRAGFKFINILGILFGILSAICMEF